MPPMTMSAAEREAYLGDGVYASVDLHTEYLWLRSPQPGNNNNVVALEPPVLARFVQYACRQGFKETIDRALKELEP